MYKNETKMKQKNNKLSLVLNPRIQLVSTVFEQLGKLRSGQQRFVCSENSKAVLLRNIPVGYFAMKRSDPIGIQTNAFPLARKQHVQFFGGHGNAVTRVFKGQQEIGNISTNKHPAKNTGALDKVLGVNEPHD